ncbi:hypothetical protein DEB41_10405 [Vibrio anguillarum]|uniref:Uncharacterized protein n=1 Tax=Vibrio anguillarum TaxID=55601 RepID=A0AAW4B0X6_VIBAN|nr:MULTISPECIES: hypothetical protein [Vibrio]AGU58208.1 hypothetical protein N175_11305 [Vibrio anguillarum M3]NAX18374.1 hypothetical protein [Vibrio sp. V22_P2S10T140]OXX35871.1 hypothetical protein B9J90_09235 [Vibrio sp. V09_P4A23P171]OXX44072.1 hypothetical protein B9J83_08650 [Vibrio sp. V07_P2A8T137]OXX57827.1 hypothetical protein B9J82_09650 [Vibrio sp. V10_P2A27P122]
MAVMKQAQQGAVTLLITTLLLVLALVVALGSYRSLFFQIKRAQNEVQARQQHWRAEGGLECGYSHIVNNKNSSIPNNLNTLCVDLELTYLSADPTNASTLMSQYQMTTLKKNILFQRGRSPGAIRSTSDLIVFGSTLISPPDPGPKNSDGKYECAAIAVAKYVIATAGVTNNGVGSAIQKPSAVFDNSADCAPTHKTNSSSQSGIWKNSSGLYEAVDVKNDIYRDETLNPFKDLFGYERGEWEKARDDTEFKFLSYTMTSGDVDCVSKFKGALVLGQPNQVWIDGSCQLNQASIDTMSTIQNAHPGTYLFLLVHNGVLGIRGSGSIQGVLFHFNSGFAADTANWNGFDTELIADLNANFDAPIKTLYGSATTLTPKHATYLQSGSFQFTGGMAFDTQGQIALFYNSLRLQYNSDIENSFSFSVPPRWQKGSWNDL